MKIKTIIIMALLISTILISGCQNSYDSCYSDCISIEIKENNCTEAIVGYNCENPDNIKKQCFNECNK